MWDTRGNAMTDLNYWRQDRRLSRRRMLRYSAGASLAAGLFVVGCGDDETSDNGTGNGGSGSQSTPAPGGTQAPSSSAPTGKVAVTVSGLGNQNYDPAKASGLGE